MRACVCEPEGLLDVISKTNKTKTKEKLTRASIKIVFSATLV